MSGKRKMLRFAGICLAVFLLLVLITQPSDLPASLLIVPFLLLFLCLLLLFRAILKSSRVAKSRSWQLALLMAGLPIVLLALQSVGQLSWRDLVTIAVLFGVSYIYVSRFTNKEN